MAFGNGPRLVTTGLDLLVDAADKQSYPGSGTVWTDLRSGITGSLTGSVSYTSEFYGGLTFTDSSSAVIFPGSTEITVPVHSQSRWLLSRIILKVGIT